MHNLKMYVWVTANAKKNIVKYWSKVEMFVFGDVKHRH